MSGGNGKVTSRRAKSTSELLSSTTEKTANISLNTQRGVASPEVEIASSVHRKKGHEYGKFNTIWEMKEKEKGAEEESKAIGTPLQIWDGAQVS